MVMPFSISCKITIDFKEVCVALRGKRPRMPTGRNSVEPTHGPLMVPESQVNTLSSSNKYHCGEERRCR